MNTTTVQPEVAVLDCVLHSHKLGGFQIFREVHWEGMRIDAILDNDEQLWGMHGKTELSEVVIAQAMKASAHPDATIIVVPDPKRVTDVHTARLKIADAHGFGVIYSNGTSWRWIVHPAPNHNANPDAMRSVLYDAQKHFAPAGSKSDYHTNDRAFVEKLRGLIADQGEVQVGKVYRAIGSPFGTNGKTVNAIKKLAANGRLSFAKLVSRDGQSYLVKT